MGIRLMGIPKSRHERILAFNIAGSSEPSFDWISMDTDSCVYGRAVQSKHFLSTSDTAVSIRRSEVPGIPLGDRTATSTTKPLEVPCCILASTGPVTATITEVLPILKEHEESAVDTVPKAKLTCSISGPNLFFYAFTNSSNMHSLISLTAVIVSSMNFADGFQKLQSFQKKIESSFDEAMRQSKQRLDRSLTPERDANDIDEPIQGRTRESKISTETKTREEAVTLVEQDALPSPANNPNDSARLKETIRELKVVNDSLLSEGTKLGKRLGLVEEKLRTKVKELEAAAREKRDLQAQIGIYERNDERLQVLEMDLKKTRSDLAQETARRLEIETQLSLTSGDNVLNSRLSDMENALNEAQEERMILIQTNRSLEIELARVQSQSDTRIQSLDTCIAQLRDEISELDSRLLNQLGNAPLVQLISPGDASPLGRSNERIEQLELLKASLESRLKSVEGELSNMAILSESTKAKLISAEKRLIESATRSASYQTEISSLKARLRTSENTQVDLARTLETELAKQDASTQEKVNELERQCTLLREELATLHARPSEVSLPLGSDKFELALQAIGKLQDELEQARLQEAELRERLDLR